MKTPALISSICLVLLAAAPISQAAITAYAADFSGDTSSFDANFRHANGGAVAGAAWGATAGVGGGGGVGVTNNGQNNFFYRPDENSSFDMGSLTAGQGFRSSADFLWSAAPIAENLTVLTIGFSTGNGAGNALSANGSLGGSIIRSADSTNLTLRIRFDNTTAPGSLSFAQSTLSPGSWYRLQVDFVKASSTTFQTMVTLYSIGADGLAAPVVLTSNSNDISISRTITASALAGDATAHSVYDVRANDGITALDNLNVTMIPEPASAALLGLGAVVFGLGRRR
ncbi:MAG: PEP-CTERM sorting domain-containing protein [Verrucomicrobiaceae bacterium]|nr:MAG: PEP-CTERM sorting domain-containing protein [Verrucomicrobiaceae bacterium]